MKQITFVVITPVRNERENLPKTIASFEAQTIRPACWVVVDDGSSDGTSELVDKAAARHDWIKAIHRPDRGFRQPGTGVVETFNAGLAALGDMPFDYIVKFDADLDFEPDYFQRCFEKFDANPRLGIGGGLICRREASGLVAESFSDPIFHVRGATKIYRRACWEQLGGLVKAPGWDTIDELKANMLGWQTWTFKDLKIHQLKDTGSADGNWKNWVKNGVANYNSGYHPVFMTAKCVRRFFNRPIGVSSCGLAWGYFKSLILGAPLHVDTKLVRYVRREQMNRLLGKPSLWKDSAALSESAARSAPV